jgi:NADPH-dependent 2,4-dienoyl-CoA reductase/sulfur reductase-like enzyme
MAPAAIYEVEAGDLTSNHKANNVADVCIVGAGPGGLMLA